jgi:hypothetical protein
MAEKGGVYVLDEPTTGLHLADVEQLLGLLDRLVDSGKSVIVINHHQAVMAHADWIIDLGPGAGHDGGRIVFEGAELLAVGETGAEAGDHDRELASGDEGTAGAEPAGTCDASSPGGDPAGEHLAGGGGHHEHGPGEEGAEQVAGPDLEGEEQEEHGGEQVAERADEGAGAGLDRAREGEPDEEGADGGGHLELLGEPADKEGHAEDGEEQRLVASWRQERAQVPAEAQCTYEDHGHRGECHGDGGGRLAQAAAGDERGGDGQVDGHGGCLCRPGLRHVNGVGGGLRSLVGATGPRPAGGCAGPERGG